MIQELFSPEVPEVPEVSCQAETDVCFKTIDFIQIGIGIEIDSLYDNKTGLWLYMIYFHMVITMPG